MSDNQGIDLSTLNNDEFITLMYDMWKEWGALYCNDHIHETGWKIRELPREKTAEYLLKIMQHHGVNLDGLRDLVRMTAVSSMCSDKGANSSLSLFIGFGHNKSNKGIVKVVNNATTTPLIMNYLRPPKKTTSFGGAAAAPQSMVGVENEKESPPPSTQKTSSSVRTPSVVRSTNKTNIKDAVHSAIRPTGATSMKSGAGMDEVSKTLDYDEVPTMVGGGNDVSSVIDSVAEELSQVSLPEGVAGDNVELDGVRIEQELKKSFTFVMGSFFGSRQTERLVAMAKAKGMSSSVVLEMISEDRCSDNLKDMTSIVSHQESLRVGTAARTETVKGILQSSLSNLSSKEALVVEKAQQRRDEKLKAAQQTHDDTVSKATREFEETVAKASLDLKSEQSKINSGFSDYKANAEMDAKVVKQELEESHAKASSELDRTQRSNADLIKPKAMLKVIELGYDMLSYYCEGNADATAKADVINNQLTEYMQPALEANDQDSMFREIINWKAKDVMEL